MSSTVFQVQNKTSNKIGAFGRHLSERPPSNLKRSAHFLHVRLADPDVARSVGQRHVESSLQVIYREHSFVAGGELHGFCCCVRLIQGTYAHKRGDLFKICRAGTECRHVRKSRYCGLLKFSRP